MPSKQRDPTPRTQRQHKWVVTDFICCSLGPQDQIIFSQFITNFTFLVWYGFQIFDNLFKISLIFNSFLCFLFAYFLTENFGGGARAQKNSHFFRLGGARAQEPPLCIRY